MCLNVNEHLEWMNGCRIVPYDETQDFPYCDEAIVLDKQNQLGFEFDEGNYIRINGLITTDEESLRKMLDVFLNIAKTYKCTNAFFCDEMDDEVLQMFFEVGFKEEEIDSKVNRCLYWEWEK